MLGCCGRSFGCCPCRGASFSAEVLVVVFCCRFVCCRKRYEHTTSPAMLSKNGTQPDLRNLLRESVCCVCCSYFRSNATFIGIQSYTLIRLFTDTIYGVTLPLVLLLFWGVLYVCVCTCGIAKIISKHLLCLLLLLLLLDLLWMGTQIRRPQPACQRCLDCSAPHSNMGSVCVGTGERSVRIINIT